VAQKRTTSAALPAVPSATRRPSRLSPAIPVRKKNRLLPLAIAGVLLLIGGSLGGYFAFRKPPAPKVGPVVAKNESEPPKKVEPPKKEIPPKKEDPPKKPDEHAEFLTRLEEKKKRATETLAECWKDLRTKRAAEDKVREEFRKRMEKRRVTIKLISGKTYQNVVLRDFNFDEIEIQAEQTETLSWILITPESTMTLANVIFADNPYDRGRLLTSRKLWKEAREAFAAAAKIDEFAEKTGEILEILDKLIAGEGAFHGSARQIGNNGLLLTYDFKKEEQLADFPGSAPAKIENGVLTLPAGIWMLSDLKFTDELDVELKARFTGKLVFSVHGCKLEVGTESLLTKDKNEIAKGTGHKGDTEAQLRIAIRGPKVELYLGSQRALEATVPVDDPKSPIGAFHFGVDDGTAKVSAPFIARGNLDPNDLQKRFAEIEILVRRAASGEMDSLEADIRAEREAKVLGKRAEYEVDLSANDSYFTFRLPNLAIYDEIRTRMIDFLNGSPTENLLENLEDVIQKHADVPGLHYFRGLYSANLGDMDEARTSFAKALELFPEFYEAMVGMARTCLWDCDFKQGLDWLDKALEQKPDNATAHAMRAMMRYGRDLKLEEATLDDLDIAYTLDSSDESSVEYRRSIRAEAKGPGHLGCIYSYESEHYRIVTDISEKAAKEYAERLETAFAWYGQYVGDLYKGQFHRKPRVAVFNTREAYYTYNELISLGRRAENTLGLYRLEFYELALFEEPNLQRSLNTLYHEAFHHFVTLFMSKRFPYWLNEGIADYMGGMTIEGGKILRKGEVLKEESQYIQMQIRMGAYPSFEKIMMMSPAEFYTGYNYPQAWSMIHFFHHAEDGKHRPLFDRYVRLLVEGKTRKEAFEAVFKDSAADLQKEWEGYVGKLKAG